MNRNYDEAVAALNTLQSNSAVVEAIQNSGRRMNQAAIPEMIEWCRRAGYEPADFDRLNAIHIAGTKGKGSTSAFISSILAQYLPSTAETVPKLKKVGLYTSPHLRFVRERIRVNNAPLSESDFAHHFFSTWDRLEDAARKAGQPTDLSAKPSYFRFLTLMAFHSYMQEDVDSAVMECGMGGEYDSTNILVHPTVTGITSLGIDHVAMLGDTIEEIAWHKAGIMKTGSAAFTSPQPQGAMDVLNQRAAEKNVKLQVIDRHPALDSITLGLAADFQKTNASLAIAVAAAHLRSLGHVEIPDKIWTSPSLPSKFQRGLEEVQWGGRCETRQEGNVTWCLDGGHTLESIELSASWFGSKFRPSGSSGFSPETSDRAFRVLIFNQQKRDASALARALHRTLAEAMEDDTPFTHVIFCSNLTFKEGGYKPDLISLNANASSVEALSVQWALKETWEDIERYSSSQRQGASVTVVKTIEEAVELVRGLARGSSEHSVDKVISLERNQVPEKTVMCLITGSVHLVGGALEVLESTKQSS
ncbi:MAG: Folylpolyglutamate synthetase [Chaenotheca gracillima]|nr:MAG: Folylpolyglutamate synthetase [Chaenotheca gracillima]